MNNNEARTLWISLGSGLLAAFLIYSHSEQQKEKLEADFGAKKNVIVARVDISEMQTIDDTMLETIQKPSEFMEPNAITDTDIAVGQVAAVPIKKGEQLLPTKLLTPGPDTGIALQVAPTKRALTLPVDEVRGVAKLIRPGDRIDIFAAIDTGKGVNSRREVSLLMQDVVVLATGVNVVNNIPRVFEMEGRVVNQISLTGDTKYSSVTIESTPGEAQNLIYLLSTSPGNIFLTLRNPNDRNTNRLPTSTAESLLGRESSTAAAPSQSPGFPGQAPVITGKPGVPPTSGR